jgi:hypothetical protein
METVTRMLLQDAEAELKIRCDDVFAKIGIEFDLICPVQEDDGFQALERGKELRSDIEAARGVLDGEVKGVLPSVWIVVKLRRWLGLIMVGESMGKSVFGFGKRGGLERTWYMRSFSSHGVGSYYQ